MNKKTSSKTDLIKEKKEEKKEEKIDTNKSQSMQFNIPVDKSIKKEESAEGVLERLIYFCKNKNVNMMKHLQRYDLTKIGKLNKSDFAKAIDELKLGLIESDIVKLLDWMKIQENYVEIMYFVNLMIQTDKDYVNFIKDHGKKISFNFLKIFLQKTSQKKFLPASTICLKTKTSI